MTSIFFVVYLSNESSICPHNQKGTLGSAGEVICNCVRKKFIATFTSKARCWANISHRKRQIEIRQNYSYPQAYKSISITSYSSSKRAQHSNLTFSSTTCPKDGRTFCKDLVCPCGIHPPPMPILQINNDAHSEVGDCHHESHTGVWKLILCVKTLVISVSFLFWQECGRRRKMLFSLWFSSWLIMRSFYSVTISSYVSFSFRFGFIVNEFMFGSSWTLSQWELLHFSPEMRKYL